MFKCTLDFGDHMLSCGDADETWKQLPILQDAHFSQNFACSSKVCWFFMCNSYGVANIHATVDENDDLTVRDLDWLIQTSINIASNDFLVLTSPDGNEMKFPVTPGLYTLQIGRKTLALEENDEPEEDVFINLITANTSLPSTVIKCPDDARLPTPLLDEVAVRH